jgi:hypothetical protein
MDFSNVMVSSSMIDPDSLNFNQKALYVTALNYLLRGERIQYDDSRLSSIGGAEYRWKKGVVSPESYTADEWGYTNCAAFCYDLYLYALGFDIGSYTTSGLIGKTSWRTYYYQPKGEISTEQATHSTTQTNTSNDVVKTIFAWIGIIVVVLIVGTIIITILNEILPFNWWNKYRYIIYPAGLALGRWLQKEFNW